MQPAKPMETTATRTVTVTAASRAPETIAATQVAPSRTLEGPRLLRRSLLHRAQAPAEAGLGTTVFGILGLITLPIALLGLLLSGGGLVWGIVAGAAALAILVAWLDPFGR